jgi:hypothetical protein
LSSAPPNIEKAVEAAERIAKDGKDAGEVVRRVRSLFKRAPIENVTLNLNDVIRDVLRLLEADIAKRAWPSPSRWSPIFRRFAATVSSSSSCCGI